MTKKIPLPSLSDKGKTITFHRFPHHIWHDQNLSLHERVVLCRVWSFLPRRCYLSYAQWAKELGCHRVTAVEILNKLVNKNKLTKSPAPEGSNEWHLVVSDYHLINEDDVASSPTLLPLVVTDYPPSSPTLPVLVVTDYPRRSLEDQLEDHKEDQIVADAPTPTCEYSLSLGEPQDSDPLRESDSLKKPIEISEAPPIPAAPPKATRKARKGAEVPFPPAEYWQGVTPSLVKWAVDNGVAESVAQKWVAQKIDDMADSAAAKGYRFIDWAAAFRKWYRKELPQDDGIEADLRKASQYVFLSAKGGEGEKPVPSSAVWPAINKAIKALGGKEYLAGLANISEEWKDKKLTELKKFARDHLEEA